MRGRAGEASGRRVLFQFESCEFTGDFKSSVDYFDEVSFFAQDEAPGLRHLEVLLGFGVGLQPAFVLLVRSQTVEGNHAPSGMTGSSIRAAVTDQMSAAFGNDAAPILGVLLERIALKRIDLVANEAGNGHLYSPGRSPGVRIASEGEQGSNRRRRRRWLRGGQCARPVVWSNSWQRVDYDFSQYSSCRATTLRLSSKYGCRGCSVQNCGRYRRTGACA